MSPGSYALDPLPFKGNEAASEKLLVLVLPEQWQRTASDRSVVLHADWSSARISRMRSRKSIDMQGIMTRGWPLHWCIQAIVWLQSAGNCRLDKQLQESKPINKQRLDNGISLMREIYRAILAS